MKYEEMKPGEINKVLEQTPVAYIAWGAHEWHGVHNPVGLDTLKAYNMTLELCKVTGGVVLPPVYCGFQTMKPWKKFKHTLEFSKDLVRQYVLEHLENLYEEGFRVIVIVMGHYGGKHVETVRNAVDLFCERHFYPRVLAVTDYEPAGWVNIQGGDHAGKNETSLMMHFRPELVELSLLPEPINHLEEGCTDNAHEASPGHGAELTRIFVQQMKPKVLELLKETADLLPSRISTGN